MMNEEFAYFNFNGIDIAVIYDECLLVDATAMAKSLDKRIHDFIRTKKTKAIVEYISKIRGLDKDSILRVCRGNRGGTWMCKELAVEFARWMSIEFGIYCNSKLDEINCSISIKENNANKPIIKTYVILDLNSGIYKIGKSFDPDDRIKALRFPGSDLKLCLVINEDVEDELHKHFDDKNVVGEWFRIDDNDVKYILSKYSRKLVKPFRGYLFGGYKWIR